MNPQNPRNPQQMNPLRPIPGQAQNPSLNIPNLILIPGLPGPVPKAPTPVVNRDRNCLCYNNNQCIQCVHRYYLSYGSCRMIPTECLSYDINLGYCYNCIPGYDLINGLCEPEQSVNTNAPNQCISCFGGYKLVNQKCVYQSKIVANDFVKKNPLCFSWSGNVCRECIPGTYLSSRSVCESIDPFCEIFDYSLETCSSCRLGYINSRGRCAAAN
jgi:hypothetical protein